VIPSQPVSAVLDAYPDWQIPGRVITTVPTADRQKATVLVRIGFNELDPRILPDMGVKVTFLREDDAAAGPAARAVTLVPKSAVRTSDGGSHVFVVRQDTVERRAIQTAGTDGNRLEVTAGLSSGDRVVIAPPDTLAPGMPIVIK
jgi:HlyD family secretion protein